MTFTPVEGHAIPEAVLEIFRNVPPEEQMAHFRLYRYHYKTTSITRSGDQFKPADYCRHARRTRCPLDEQELLIQGGVIIGVRILGRDIFCYENPIGCLTHANGQRTSSDYWYYDEDHYWYTFTLGDERP